MKTKVKNFGNIFIYYFFFCVKTLSLFCVRVITRCRDLIFHLIRSKIGPSFLLKLFCHLADREDSVLSHLSLVQRDHLTWILESDWLRTRPSHISDPIRGAKWSQVPANNFIFHQIEKPSPSPGQGWIIFNDKANVSLIFCKKEVKRGEG